MAKTTTTTTTTTKSATAAYKAAEAAFAGLLVDMEAARDSVAKHTGEVTFDLITRAFDAGKQASVPARMREIFKAHNEGAKSRKAQPLAESYIKQVASYAARLCALSPAQWAALLGTGSRSLQILYKKAGETFPELVKKTGAPKSAPKGETGETGEKAGKVDFSARLSEALAAISRLKAVANNPATLATLGDVVDLLADLEGLPG